MRKVFLVMVAAVVLLVGGIQIGKHAPDSLPTPTPSKKESSFVGLVWGIVAIDKTPTLSWQQVVEQEGNPLSGYRIRDAVHTIMLRDGSRWTMYKHGLGSMCVEGEVRFCLLTGYDPWVRMEFNHYYEMMGYDRQDVIRVVVKGHTLYLKYVDDTWYVGY